MQAQKKKKKRKRIRSFSSHKLLIIHLYCLNVLKIKMRIRENNKTSYTLAIIYILLIFYNLKKGIEIIKKKLTDLDRVQVLIQ